MKVLKADVLIAGSGPAGASCAKALTDAGLKALVIEKGILPRHKTCSGVLFGQTQELLKNILVSYLPKKYIANHHIYRHLLYASGLKERDFREITRK